MSARLLILKSPLTNPPFAVIIKIIAFVIYLDVFVNFSPITRMCTYIVLDSIVTKVDDSFIIAININSYMWCATSNDSPTTVAVASSGLSFFLRVEWKFMHQCFCHSLEFWFFHLSGLWFFLTVEAKQFMHQWFIQWLELWFFHR